MRNITHEARQKQVLMYTSNRIAHMRMIKITFSIIFLIIPFRSCDPYIMTFEPSLPAGGKGPYTLTSYKSPQVRTWLTLRYFFEGIFLSWFFFLNICFIVLILFAYSNKSTTVCTNLVHSLISFFFIRMLFWQKSPLFGNYRYLDQRRAN